MASPSSSKTIDPALDPTAVIMLPPWPLCSSCRTGVLVPLSDYGTDGASVQFKAWVCTSGPTCGFNIRCDKGTVTYGLRATEGKR